MELKSLANLYRTIGGVRYPGFANWLTPEHIARLRAAGVRYRQWRDVTYVHQDDHISAQTALQVRP